MKVHSIQTVHSSSSAIHAGFERRTKWQELKALLNGERVWTLRPQSGVWLVDLAHLILLCWLQMDALPRFLGGYSVDLVTPWLLIGWVKGSKASGLALTVCASWVLESYTSLPAGFYLCSYGMACMFLFLTRSAFTWHHVGPWVLSFLCVHAVLIVCEVAVIELILEHMEWSWFDAMFRLGHVLLSGAVGFVFVQPYLRQLMPEEGQP